MQALVPTQSGLYFCGCPNCQEGAQEGQFDLRGGGKFTPWSIQEPDVLRCKYCGQVYPCEKYAMRGVLEVKNPRGETQRYPYHEDATGFRHYFAARIDDHKIRYLERAANQLARLYVATREPLYARRCALILERFAQVYPGYCYHFDYPFQEKVITSGDVAPKDFRPGFRTARWSWWAYMDIPTPLVEAYDLVAPSGEWEKLSAETGRDAQAEIEGFFTAATEQVLANPDDLTNMSPGMWADVIRAGRVLGKPEYVHVAIGRLRQFMVRQFFYDGAWKEGAPSYHSQVLGGLQTVFAAAKGYSDPAGFTVPGTGERFTDLDTESALPEVARSRQALDLMRLPNGRLVPVHDTWSTNSLVALSQSASFLLPGLGHACLGRGAGPTQTQVHLTWSGGYGHQHEDGLSLILFAQGKELLSDLGYTHTKARGWTLATAAHNTVAVDHRNQEAVGYERDTYGSLRTYDAADDRCRVVSVDDPQVYPGVVTVFRRTVALVGLDAEHSLVVDCFQVAGGGEHDYFLHGSADEPQTLTASGAEPFAPLATLVPAGTAFVPARNEGECGKVVEPGWAYGYLQGLRQRAAAGGEVAALDFRGAEGAGLRACAVLDKDDGLILGTDPAVRPAGENDMAIDAHQRAFAMVRRTGGESAFVSVIEAFGGQPVVKAVRALAMPGARRAVEIELTSGRRDLLLLEARKVTAQWGGQSLSATGEFILLSHGPGAETSATVAVGAVRWGDVSLEAAAAEHRLLGVDRGGRVLTVEGAWAPAPGSTIVVDHAGKRVSGYTVSSAAVEGGATRVTVLEDPGFEWEAATKTSRFVFVPQLGYSGDHVVRQRAVAHWPRQGGSG